MKKIAASLLCMIMLTGLLCGCGAGEAPLKLTLVVADAFDDSAFYGSAKEGCERLAADGVQVTMVECYGEEHVRAIREAAETSELVVLVGYDFKDVETIAPEYPNVYFVWVDNETTAPVENVLNLTYAQNEGSFLAGYIAARMSETGIVGTVAGMDNVTLNDFIVGFRQGARYADPDVEVEVSYANTYNDPAIGKACALALHEQGADVIFQIAAQTGNGVFEAARERGFWAIGVDSNQKHLAEDVILCSMCKEIGQSICDVVHTYRSGDKSLWGTTWVADLSAGLVNICYGGEGTLQQVPDSVKAEVEALEEKIISGEIRVDTTR